MEREIKDYTVHLKGGNWAYVHAEVIREPDINFSEMHIDIIDSNLDLTNNRVLDYIEKEAEEQWLSN